MELLELHTGRDSYYLQLAIERSVFHPMPRKPETPRKRILLVGNYLMPYKGMADGLAALRLLSAEMPVDLVIATQERRSREFFADLPFPVEVHFCPPETAMPAIMASCDVYCCTSWYEGLGLPALECFCCDVPVVSTRTFGVMDYARDGQNLLLAQPNDPADLARQLRRVLVEPGLAERLRRGGADTVEVEYRWDATIRQFIDILHDVDRSYTGAGVVDTRAMTRLLTELEANGSLTPIEIFRRYDVLSAELDDVIRTLLANGPSPEGLEVVHSLREAFGLHATNERAQYFGAFRAKYDFCGLILGLRTHPKFVDYLSLVLHQSHDRATHTPVSLSEIRY
jgi:hypothetical protein